MADIHYGEVVQEKWSAQLPCGMTIPVHKLNGEQWNAALALFAINLESMTILLQRDLTEDDVRGMMPTVLFDKFQQTESLGDIPTGRDTVTAFLGCFITDITADELAQLRGLEDWEALWAVMWEVCRYPFVLMHSQMANTGAYCEARMEWMRITAKIDANAQRESSLGETSSASSPAPASMSSPAASAPSSTSSPSRKRRKSTNSAPPPAMAPSSPAPTRQRKQGTPPPGSG